MLTDDDIQQINLRVQEALDQTILFEFSNVIQLYNHIENLIIDDKIREFKKYRVIIEEIN